MAEEITSFRGEYQFLSNFAHSPFQAHVYRDPWGVYLFKTVEHFFQACKPQLQLQSIKIAKATTARHAKTMGRMCMPWDDWEEIKQDVMLLGLRYKFSKPEFGDKLLATGEAVLIEGNTWNDRYWGMSPVRGANGTTWVGENHLGILLMQVRQELQESK